MSDPRASAYPWKGIGAWHTFAEAVQDGEPDEDGDGLADEDESGEG